MWTNSSPLLPTDEARNYVLTKAVLQYMPFVWHNHRTYTLLMSPHISRHGSEWVYSTSITRRLQLSELNHYIHTIPSVPHPIEFFVFICGYAFNPVMFPFWLGLVHKISYWSLLSNTQHATNKHGDIWRELLATVTTEQGALINTAFYCASVLVILAFTELGKASFTTTRPPPPESNDATRSAYENKDNTANCKWNRRYGSLVSSLKSKHSFPSGDCAQAMNLCIFLWRYVPTTDIPISRRDLFMFGLFLPGVVFARIFYLCHYVEDCLGGVVLTSLLHWVCIPSVGTYMFRFVSS